MTKQLNMREIKVEKNKEEIRQNSYCEMVLVENPEMLFFQLLETSKHSILVKPYFFLRPGAQGCCISLREGFEH